MSEVQKLTSIARRCEAGPDSVRPEGGYFVPLEPNAFGLPAIETCPGRTEYCEQDCYALQTEFRRATYEKLQRNHEALLATQSIEEMADLLRAMMLDYVGRADKLGVPPNKRNFRIHWDGDFFSTDYAKAWRQVIQENPEVQFWAYTRSFQPSINVIPVLDGLENLDLFMSVDHQNVDRAAEVLAENTDVKVAYLVDYFEDVDALRARLGRQHSHRRFACPENIIQSDGERKLDLISDKGGACSLCTYCIKKPEAWDVTFVKKRAEFRSQPSLPFAEEVPVVLRRGPRPDPGQRVGALAIPEALGSDPQLF